MKRAEQILILKRSFDKIHISLDDLQYEQLLDYYEILIEKNKVMNLTGIVEFKEVAEKHFMDSLIFSEGLTEKHSQPYVIDVGTGAGFPGIPLKIVYPSMKIVLLDSLKKRIGFLQEVIELLGLKGIEAIHSRAEDAGRSEEYREQFDFCVSRAVADLRILSEYCMPFVKVGGSFISYKSGDIQEEIQGSKKAIHLLGGEVEESRIFQLPETDMNRSLIYIKKILPIGKRYPRKAGLPKREPLG